MTARTMYCVVAQVRQGELWTNICSTYDKDTAQGTYQDFKDARVPVRIDVIEPRERTRTARRSAR